VGGRGGGQIEPRCSNRLRPPREGQFVPLGLPARALGWWTERFRAVDDLLKPIRVADGTRLYHVERALAFVGWMDDLNAWSDAREARLRRSAKRRNFARVKRSVDAADPIALLRVGAPTDEYDSEVREIVRWLPECRTEREIHTKLHRLFVRRFTRRVAGPSDAYAELAKTLFSTPIATIVPSDLKFEPSDRAGAALKPLKRDARGRLRRPAASQILDIRPDDDWFRTRYAGAPARSVASEAVTDGSNALR